MTRIKTTTDLIKRINKDGFLSKDHFVWKGLMRLAETNNTGHTLDYYVSNYIAGRYRVETKMANEAAEHIINENK